MDQSGHPEGDNDIVEQYKNPSKADLASIPREASPVVHERLWFFARGLR
jgi:hypothetical protein